MVLARRLVKPNVRSMIARARKGGKNMRLSINFRGSNRNGLFAIPWRILDWGVLLINTNNAIFNIRMIGWGTLYYVTFAIDLLNISNECNGRVIAPYTMNDGAIRYVAMFFLQRVINVRVMATSNAL